MKCSILCKSSIAITAKPRKASTTSIRELFCNVFSINPFGLVAILAVYKVINFYEHRKKKIQDIIYGEDIIY